MTFFDSKEEVLDIKLTQYGRHLLSKGRLKPVYYAFFDEGVLYDSDAAGFSEDKNSAETRIQDETPFSKTQHCFTGRDEFLFDGVGDKEDRLELGIYEKMFTLTDSLGTSELGSIKAPYFSTTFLDGKIKSIETTQTGTLRTINIPSGSDSFYSQQLLNIPQLSVDVEYKISVFEPGKLNVKFDVDHTLSPNNEGVRQVYKNGLAVAVGPDDILILMEEGNTTCNHKNFDIEVFEMSGVTGSLGEEVLTPLSFEKPIEMIKNNILLDKKEARRQAGLKRGETVTLDTSFVEYYMDVKTDEEINKTIVCTALHKIKKKGKSIYSPCGIDFDCPDLEGVLRLNAYASDAEEGDCL